MTATNEEGGDNGGENVGFDEEPESSVGSKCRRNVLAEFHQHELGQNDLKNQGDAGVLPESLRQADMPMNHKRRRDDRNNDKSLQLSSRENRPLILGNDDPKRHNHREG